MTDEPRYGQRAGWPGARPEGFGPQSTGDPSPRDSESYQPTRPQTPQRAPRPSRGRSGGLLSQLSFSNLPVTTALIAINALMGVAQLFSSQVTNWTAFSPVAGYLQPWRFLTAAFVHGGFFHLLFNMMMLLALGQSVERALGWWRYLSVYLLSAFAGSMGMLAWVFVDQNSWQTWSLGASGAVYGLIAAVFVLQKRSGMSTQSILILLGINVVYGFVVPGIAWQAHVGGFLGGLIVSAVFLNVAEKTLRIPPKARTRIALAALAGLVVLFVGATWGIYALLLR